MKNTSIYIYASKSNTGQKIESSQQEKNDTGVEFATIHSQNGELTTCLSLES